MFIHSSVDGHLDSFHSLAVVNNAAVNIHVQVFMCSFILGTYLGVKFLGHMATLCSTFLGDKLITERDTYFIFLPEMYERVQTPSHSYQHIVIYLFFFFFFFFLAAPHCMWDLSSLTRDLTHAPCSGNVES